MSPRLVLAGAALAACNRVPPPAEAVPPLVPVELAGRFELPPGVAGEARVVLTDGPCWQQGSRVLVDQWATPPSYSAEAFVRRGARVWACAFVLPPGGGAITLTDASADRRADVLGLNRWDGVDLRPRPGAPVSRPTR
jgi:hypothetical protein